MYDDDSPYSRSPFPIQGTTHYRLRGLVQGQERSFRLLNGRNGLGSDVGNEVVLDEVGVSRRHATVIVEGQRITAIDEGSKNGTFVNGHTAARAELTVGDRLACGPVELWLEEVHPGDTRLAVELFKQASAHGEAWISETRTLATQAEPALRSMSLLARTLARMRRQEPGQLGAWLGHLVDELSAEGAAVLELVDGGESRVLQTCGKVAMACHDRLAELWREHPEGRSSKLPADGLWLAEEGEPSFAAWVGDEGRTLMICGRLTGREELRPLLNLAYEIMEGLIGQGSRSAPEVEGSPVEGLRFPPGHVRSVAAAMVAVYDQMKPLIQGDLPVLIRGETGVGKELVAHALHLSSARRQGPFVAINCAALPAELLEAELFGIGERVATGVSARRGTFQRAQGGTLFLDEIAEMPTELQAKLLRVLQDKRLQPLGAPPVDIDVRVLAATNADIDALMQRGAFRQDLYFRIAGYVLSLPPLRRRREDIPLLLERFLRRFCEEISKPIRGLTVRALEALVNRPWPGNIRQLEHEARRLVYLCPAGEAIEHSMLAMPDQGAGEADAGTSAAWQSPTAEAVGQAAADGDGASPRLPTLKLEPLERLAVQQAMERVSGNQGQAASLLGITRSSLRRRLKRHQVT